MEIIPAIYVLNGKCVALYKSHYEQKETYYKSPLEMAQSFQKQGAKKIYLVDLNGKQKETFEQKELFKKIIKTVEIPVQIEAGFQTLEEIQEALEFGAHQIILRSPSIVFTREVIQKFGAEKIIIQIQAKGSAVIDGEKKHPEDELDVVDYAELLIPLGVRSIVYKDESSEGTLIHPNYDEVDRLFLVTGQELKIYVAGGISEPRHLQLLKKIGASGAIIGKAFYEHLLSIKEAEEAVA